MKQRPSSSLDHFIHRQAAHCESGTVAGLCHAAGIAVSEPMAFGIGSGLFFVHLPFFKIMDIPLTSFRSFPGSIASKAFSRLGMDMIWEKFRSPILGERALDKLLDDGVAVGVQVSVMWLPYLPRRFRFPFNSHHVSVLRRERDRYLVSDPLGEHPEWCPVEDFTHARFAAGALAPHGLLYAPKKKPSDHIPAKAIVAGIKETVNRMRYSPLPFVGLPAIRLLARRVESWTKSPHDDLFVKLLLTNVVRMAEEIGTGGAGFRYLYAAFLSEAATFFDSDELHGASQCMTACGDTWREFSTAVVQICKNSEVISAADGQRLAETLRHLAGMEGDIFRLMSRALRTVAV